MKIHLDAISTWVEDLGVNGDASDLLVSQGLEFSYSKHYDLAERSILLSTGMDALVLNSFAGSGINAQAVLLLSAVDGGARCFVLIELED